MDCKNHKQSEAICICRCCGEPICLECAVALSGKNYCKECLSKIVNSDMSQDKAYNGTPFKRKSKFLTFCLSIVPGGGHMYIGLINKGLTLMATYFSVLFCIIFLSDTLHINWLNGFLIPAVSIMSIFYSVFESNTLVNHINSGRSIEDSEAIKININYEFLYSRFQGKKKIIGYVLVILGAIGCFNITSGIIVDILHTYFRLTLPFRFSQIVMPLILMFIGFYLVRKSRNENY